jgi:hypothetical protein
VGMDRVWKTFKFVIIFMVLLSGGMIYLSLYALVGWEITSWTSRFSRFCFEYRWQGSLA